MQVLEQLKVGDHLLVSPLLANWYKTTFGIEGSDCADLSMQMLEQLKKGGQDALLSAALARVGQLLP